MRATKFFANLLVVVALTLTPAAEATTVTPVTVAELTRNSDDVIVGTVRRSSSRWDGAFIVTDHEIEVVTALRGRLPARATIVVRVAGGVVGRIAQYIPDAPVLELSRTYTLFMAGGISNVRYLTHLTAAAVPVTLDAASGRVQATVSEALVMSGAAPVSSTAHARTVIDLDVLARAVRTVAP